MGLFPKRCSNIVQVLLQGIGAENRLKISSLLNMLSGRILTITGIILSIFHFYAPVIKGTPGVQDPSLSGSRKTCPTA